ncbi:type B DNA-directed DNA polymerase [Halobaculum sp. MBLA0147]|uniref:type B DNA-directed DNA polymerase n=1 Tax=Halobaculum sp. MBLA0147 TaxID=3079934 RepID=UPI003525F28E
MSGRTSAYARGEAGGRTEMLTADWSRDGPVAWAVDGDKYTGGASATVRENCDPVVYAVSRRGVEQRNPDMSAVVGDLHDLSQAAEAHPAVRESTIVWRQPGYRCVDQPVLRLAVDCEHRTEGVGEWIESHGPPGQRPYRPFNIDLSPQFRVALETEVSVTPSRPLRVVALGVDETALGDRETGITLSMSPAVTGSDAIATACARQTTISGSVEEVLGRVASILRDGDPDVLVVDGGAVLRELEAVAAEAGVTLPLGRQDGVPTDGDGVREVAAASTYSSYGQREYSPARFTVPGRVVIDRSNSFLLEETNLAGCLDLVERTGKPLEELAWASAGAVFTALQIREAVERDVLVQWRAWRPEGFKSARTLQAADRGGLTLSPSVGVHEDVHELDFGSMFPNLIVRENLSPETVRCQCHGGRDVPELGYTLCPDDGVLPDVLEPLIDERDQLKDRLDSEEVSAGERSRLEGRASALKWVLVTAYGYQAFSHAKFGRIEVHEAINAYARDVLLEAKTALEDGGWRVLHGIIDSIWVTPRPDTEQRPLPEIAQEVSIATEIPLEYEGGFDWVAFCTTRDGEAGALTRYYGKRAGEDEYKIRGVECRQRSTCAWIDEVQRECIGMMEADAAVDEVLRRVATALERLEAGDVPAEELVITERVSKPFEAYSHATPTVLALQRAHDRGRDVHPGQDIAYVISDHERQTVDAVRLLGELGGSAPIDRDEYRRRLVRAVASVLSAVGITVEDIEDRLADGHDVQLASY